MRTKIPPSKIRLNLFVFILHFNVPVNNFGHVGTVTSDFVGLLLYIEINGITSPAIKNRTSKQLMLICKAVRHTTYHEQDYAF